MVPKPTGTSWLTRLVWGSACRCVQMRAALSLCCKMQAGFDSLMTAQLFAYLRAISPTQVREAMLLSCCQLSRLDGLPTRAQTGFSCTRAPQEQEEAEASK